ncbi:MAG: hypothetical protein H0W25_00885 [Acidimicrobiia bacterium]|nr:hypothetical protein [Acidimicrobiia bacterium]
MKHRLVRFIRGTAFRRGVLGASSRWFGLWAGMAFARKVRQRLGKEAVVVERITLKKGEAVEIRDTGVSRGSVGLK